MTARRTKRIVSAVLATTAVPVLLAGCAPSAPSSDDIAEEVRIAVESIDSVDGALVRLSSAGIDALAVRVKIYLSDESALSASVDATLDTVWRTVPRAPDHISISAVVGPMPDDARLSTPDGVDLVPIAQALGLRDTRTSLDVLLVPEVALIDRYGPWKQ